MHHSKLITCVLILQSEDTARTNTERYCKFGNFREYFIFTNSIKRHISDVKNSRIRQDLPLSINDRVILPFRKGFIFTKLRICEVSRK